MLTLPSDQPSYQVILGPPGLCGYNIQKLNLRVVTHGILILFTALVRKFGQWTFDLDFGLRSSDSSLSILWHYFLKPYVFIYLHVYIHIPFPITTCDRLLRTSRASIFIDFGFKASLGNSITQIYKLWDNCFYLNEYSYLVCWWMKSLVSCK